MEQEITIKQERLFQYKELWSRQKEILRLFASGLYTQRQIAKMLNVSAQTINNIVCSTLGKQTLEMLEGAADYNAVDLLAKMKALAPIALAVQENLMLSESTRPRLQNDIANKMLDRAGYAAPTRNINFNVNAGLSFEELEAIKSRAQEIENVQFTIEEEDNENN